MSWGGYRDKIDRYYFNVLIGEPGSAPPGQDMPPVIGKVIATLNREGRPGFVDAGAHVLDGSEAARQMLHNAIEQEIREQSLTRRIRPLSAQGKWAITVFIRTPYAPAIDRKRAIIHTCADMQISGGKKRTLLLAEVGADGELQSVDFEFITPQVAQSIGEGELAPVRHQLYARRMARAAGARDRGSM